jgi:N utilization substance protein A
VDLGRATAIMPEREQIPGEHYRVGGRIKVYLKGIERNDRGADMIVSRAAAEFVEYLFRQEVPELENGLVEIKAIAREAGRRTKIAVAAGSAGIDPVGTLVGGRGVRVQAVQSEIGDREKIDVVIWSDNMPEFIREALSPAEIMRVELDNENHRAKVFVAEDQQSIAIGKQGQNVRLASRLTGYDLDIELDQKPKTVKKTSRGAEDSLLSAIEDIAE